MGGLARKSTIVNDSRNKGYDFLIADAGTILSLTRITAAGAFAGGQLVAGLRLQLSAMAIGANALKEPGKLEKIPEKFPSKTAPAMHRGVLEALIGMLIEAQKTTRNQLWLCGGDSSLLFEELKQRNADVVHHPNLVLEGMTSISDEINPIQDQK